MFWSRTFLLWAWAELILQPFRHFTYVTTHSPTIPTLHLHHNSFSILPSLYLRYSSFSNTFVASPTSQFILQPFFCFSYVTSSSPPMRSIHIHRALVELAPWGEPLVLQTLWANTHRRDESSWATNYTRDESLWANTHTRDESSWATNYTRDESL